MNSDVRDILNLPETNTASSTSQVLSKVTSGRKKKVKRLIEPIKRPEGINREVWSLMCKYDTEQPPLIPSQETTKLYKHPKAQLRQGVKKWHFVDFKNEARTDNARFSHWRPVSDDPNKEYPFAKFNKKVNLIKYTDAEYAQYLSHDDSWSRADTDQLFELCQRYELRFYVIHDRWDPVMCKKRTIDELKERYYKCVGILQKVRLGLDDSQIYVFDLEHEHKRREQLEKLFNRTKEQLDEEVYLMEELKKIEIRKREREKKQQDLNKLITAAGEVDNKATSSSAQQKQIGQLQKNKGGALESRSSSVGGPPQNKRLKQKKLTNKPNNSSANAATSGVGSGSNSLNNSVENLAAASPSLNTSAEARDTKSNRKALLYKGIVDSTGIKFPDAKTTGVTLRSYRMKLPQSVGIKKLKVIEQILDELQLEQKPIATENICEQFNELRSDIVLLYELHQALTNLEFELQTLRHRYETIAPGKTLDSTLFENSYSSTSSLFSSLAPASNTPQKRLSEIFDSSMTPTGPLERRRRAALNQTNILKKLRGRNPV